MTAKKRSRSYQVWVDQDTCDGCGVCIFFCKPRVFRLSSELSRRGVFPVIPEKMTECNNCRLCELGCPQLAIAIVREDDPADDGLLKFSRTEPDESSGHRWQGARRAHTGGTQLTSNTASGVQGPSGDAEGDFQQPDKTGGGEA